MRKVTETIANAFAQGINKTVGNTKTTGFSVFLHDNKIVEIDSNGSVYMSLAGWNTTTTRERLNGIAQVLGLNVSFNQKAFEPYLNGKLIDASKWYKVN